MLQVCHMFISPGHNFFGHHGQPAGKHPIVAVEQIECVAGHGIRGDRFFDYKPDYMGQITFFAMEVIEAMARELNLAGVRPEMTRRNVFTRGADLNTLIGVEFEIQGGRFVGTEECRPCYWMNNAFRDERVEAWLQGRGGLRARILTDAVLKCGGQGQGHEATRGGRQRKHSQMTSAGRTRGPESSSQVHDPTFRSARCTRGWGLGGPP